VKRGEDLVVAHLNQDALQETLPAAWQGLGGFEGRASIRTSLYRIAANQCLNALRSASRRPAKEWDIPEIEPPEPTHLGEVVWLEPYPDSLLEGAIEAREVLGRKRMAARWRSLCGRSSISSRT
jgi:DNA-directed RNA polymerase specialized sigma24 family protein